MPQMISRNTVLLEGAGRSNIVYSAGPNISIQDDVISGRDWTQDIQDAVNSGVAGQLSAGDNIALNTENNITTISVTGELYSAGPNIAIENRTISGKDWTQDISDQIASAISGKADASAIPEIVEYSAGDNIDITDHVISGKDWSYEIGQKVDRSEVIERISAASESIVNNLTETISSTSSEIIDIISATSGQGSSGGCIWISGAKDYDGETLQLSADSVIPILSGWDLSGDHNHSICMKGRYIRMPGSADFYTRSEWNNFYSAGWSPNINALYASAAYLNNIKLDISAFTAYSAAHSADDDTPYSGASGIKVEDHLISITGDVGKTYSAGDNIDITNEVVSGKDWTREIVSAISGKADKSQLSAYIPFSAIGGDSATSAITGINGSGFSGMGAGGDNISYQVLDYIDWQTVKDHFNSSSVVGVVTEPSQYGTNMAQCIGFRNLFTSGKAYVFNRLNGNMSTTYVVSSNSDETEFTTAYNSIWLASHDYVGEELAKMISYTSGGVSASGNLAVTYVSDQHTPSRITVNVGNSAVGSLAPTAFFPYSILVQDGRGGIVWKAKSAVYDAPSYYSKSLGNDDDQDWVLTAHPTMDHDWVLDVYNDSYGASSQRFYFSGGTATGTLEPGQGVRMHYNVEEDYLVAEPIYTVGEDGYGDYYARRYEDLDGVKIRVTGSSAGLPSNDDILYIVTGTN